MASPRIFPSCGSLPKNVYDYIVIGAGSSGCAATAAIVQSVGSAASVLLIEAGPPTNSVFVSCPLLAAGIVGQYPIARKYNWSLNSTIQKGLEPPRTSYIPRGCGLGGSSAINAMLYIRGHPLDYDDDWGKAFPSWTFDKVLPEFTAMEGNTAHSASAIHGTSGPLAISSPDSNLLSLPFNKSFRDACIEAAGLPETPDFNGSTTFGVGVYQQTARNGKRVSAWDAHCAPLQADAKYNGSFHVAVNSLATSLDIDAKTGLVSRVNVARRTVDGRVDRGQTTSIGVSDHGEVIVSLGAIHTPGLLMRSGIGSPTDLRRLNIVPKIDNANVGTNLMEHYDVTLTLRTKSSAKSRGASPSALPFTASQIREYLRAGTGTFSNIVEYGAFLFSDRAKNRLSIEEQIKQRLRPNLQLHFLPGPLINHAREVPLYNGFSLHVCNLYPKSRGTVAIATSDAAADPLVDFQYLADPADVDVMKHGCSLAMDILNSKPFREFDAKFVNPPNSVAQSIREASNDQSGEVGRMADGSWPDAALESIDRHVMRRYADNIYHPMGSCSMGLVVDERLRVKGARNLRVADASVIPIPLGGNTNAPCQMIGARCGQFVVEDRQK